MAGRNGFDTQPLDDSAWLQLIDRRIGTGLVRLQAAAMDLELQLDDAGCGDSPGAADGRRLESIATRVFDQCRAAYAERTADAPARAEAALRLLACALDELRVQTARWVADLNDRGCAAVDGAIRAVTGQLDELEARQRAMQDLVLLRQEELRLTPAITDFGDLVREAIARLVDWYGEDASQIRLTIAPDLPPAWCDAARWRPLVLALLRYSTTAAQFWAPRAAPIAVTLVAGERVLTLTASDAGLGLTPPDLEALLAVPQLGIDVDVLPDGPYGTIEMCAQIARLGGGAMAIAPRADRPGTAISLRVPAVVVVSPARIA